MNALPVPRAADIDVDSAEVLRLWKVPKVGQQVILRHDAWEDPAAWGLMLVDIARHVARAHGKKDETKNKYFNASWLVSG